MSEKQGKSEHWSSESLDLPLLTSPKQLSISLRFKLPRKDVDPDKSRGFTMVVLSQDRLGVNYSLKFGPRCVQNPLKEWAIIDLENLDPRMSNRFLHVYPQSNVADNFAKQEHCDPLMGEVWAASVKDILDDFSVLAEPMFGIGGLYVTSSVPPWWLQELECLVRRHHGSFLP